MKSDTKLLSEILISQSDDFEIYRRMGFSEFDKNVINCFINLEKKIIVNSDSSIPLINKIWWTNEQNINLANLQKCFFKLSKHNCHQLLSFSELISLFDEADYILENCHLYSKDVIDEAKKLHDRKSKYSIINEILYRFKYIYQLCSLEFDINDYNKVLRLVINESHILFLHKYSYHQNKKFWRPYTDDYYIYHNI